MKEYMSYCSQYLQHMNKLQQAFKEFIKMWDRQIMTEDEMKIFKQTIIDGVGELNRKHPKCTPIKVSFWSPGGSDLEDKDIFLNDSSHRVVFTILRGKEFLS